MIPSAGTPIRIKELLRASLNPIPPFSKGGWRGGFRKEGVTMEDALKGILNVKHCFLVNSGTTAFFIILQTLKQISSKDEIILPAYTAPSLILPVKKAGLKYRLVDMSLDTFNMDVDKAIEAVSNDTLAVLCVHMFGLPMDIEKLKLKIKNQKSEILVIEDAASSFGTKKYDKFTGTFGDIGFISFNRGKNLSTVSGGVIVTDDDRFAKIIKEERAKLRIPDFVIKTKIFLKALGLSLAVRPWFYTIFRHAISSFKYTALHEDFDSFHYTGFQEALGCLLLKRAEDIFRGREEKGRLLYNAIKNINGIMLPIMPDGWQVAFNQFPILIEDKKKRMKVVDAIIRAGVESTMLYDKPIHEIYHDGSNQQFPNAEYMAERLVLIPVHHYVAIKGLYKLLDVIESEMKECSGYL